MRIIIGALIIADGNILQAVYLDATRLVEAREQTSDRMILRSAFTLLRYPHMVFKQVRE